ncbi:DNA-dependent RNA polymerase subunit epsilon [Alkalibacillus sp. S2W]|uniref:DNA-directed RNA polymerase subunit epsilon n=1 Tax=Alkalibacillus salilacus TaxID=284582 RepID=A0ABT9VGJ0_9BACI|nr:MULTISPECIES: DNA-directed RNA polymerase subunit epsilon [Alkalibacillus]MDQ0160086.1 DNA-dependent RNA polymerase auxiliary subunit epsilon [Alkalibacillus salilacus]NIK13341.1 DNA-dependent RNA polymerase auxiliary subunit epsilon [Alkalibacillus almallahensis]
MVFKVLYQENITEAPVREETKTMYVEAETKREVREKLADRPYNIEHVQELSEAHLAYEQQSENFKVEDL